jgi:hypothetical protein
MKTIATAAALIALATSLQAHATSLLGPTAGALLLKYGYDVSSSNESDVGFEDYAIAPITPTVEGTSCSALKSKVDPDATNIPVKKDDVYEVILKHVKLGKDVEDALPINVYDWLRGAHEVAIVVNSFELSNDPTAAPGFDFSSKDGHVVYFSDDVKAEQQLNLGEISMIPPTKYGGNPVGLTIQVFKVGSSGGSEVAPLISELAKLGRNASANPEVYGLLTELGSGLLQSKNLRLLRYDTMLRSADVKIKGTENLKNATLRYGDYILIRRQNRTAAFDWSKYSYDAVTGKIYSNKGCSKDTEERDMSYGVIQVSPASYVAYMNQVNFQTLKTGLLASFANSPLTASNVEFANKIDDKIKSAAAEIKENMRYASAMDLIRSIAKADKTSPPDLKQQVELGDTLKLLFDSISDKYKTDKGEYTLDHASGLLKAIKIVLGDKYPTNETADAVEAAFKSGWK